MTDLLAWWLAWQLIVTGFYTAWTTWHLEAGIKMKRNEIDNPLSVGVAICIGVLVPLLTIIFYLRNGGQEVED